MLLNDFFTIQNSTDSEGVLSASITIKAGHKIFEGHFPDNPITPGVVQLQIVKELLEESLGQKFTMSEMGRCKFLAIWNPNDNPNINVEIKHSKTEDNEIKISASGGIDDTFFFKFNAKYRIA